MTSASFDKLQPRHKGENGEIYQAYFGNRPIAVKKVVAITKHFGDIRDVEPMLRSEVRALFV